MGGFEVAWNVTPRPLVWCAVDDNARSYDTLYEGQLVQTGPGVGLYGVAPLGAAAGVADTTSDPAHVPFGVVVGQNRKEPLYNSTYKGFYITSEDPHASTTEYVGVEGPWPKGDKCAMVLVELIYPTTILKGRIFNATYGTAITVGTVTTASTTGAGFACSAGLSDASTPVGALGTVYCRSGANRGIYRITTDTSATTKTVAQYFPYDIALGDTFVNVQMRPWGQSYVQTDTESMFFTAAANPATDYWIIDVIKLDLSEAGNEYVLFKFNADHFCYKRA
jgi:hypothetical protein